MTSLERPVVPEVGMSTARSPATTPASGSGPAAAAAAPRGPASPAPGRRYPGRRAPGRPPRRRRRQPGQPAIGDQRTRAGLGDQAGQLGRGPARIDRDRDRADDARASQDMRYDGVVRAVTTTRSPRPIPALPRARAVAPTRVTAPEKVSSRSRCAATCRPGRARPPAEQPGDGALVVGVSAVMDLSTGEVGRPSHGVS